MSIIVALNLGSALALMASVVAYLLRPRPRRDHYEIPHGDYPKVPHGWR